MLKENILVTQGCSELGGKLLETKRICRSVGGHGISYFCSVLLLLILVAKQIFRQNRAILNILFLICSYKF